MSFQRRVQTVPRRPAAAPGARTPVGGTQPGRLLALQQAAGNRAVQRVLAVQRLPYDAMQAGRWYTVSGYDQPLYLRQKRRDGPFEFSYGSHGPAQVIIKDESLIVAEAYTQPPPAWFVPTGDATADVDKLVKRLIAEGEKDGSAVAKLVTDIRVHGVRAAYQEVSGAFPDLLTFATRCKDLTSGESDEETLEEIGYPERKRRWRDALSPVTELTTPIFDERVTELGLSEIGKGGNREEWDRPYASLGGMWTDGMGPCITVGLTAVHSVTGVRFNALLHSFSDVTGTMIFKSLTGQFDGKRGLPKFAELTGVSYFIVGGSSAPVSVDKADELLSYAMNAKLPILGATLTTHPSEAQLTKAVMITAEGKVYYTSYTK